MTDYRDLMGVSELASETNGGNGVRVAVLDTGIPSIPGVPVYLSYNMTDDSSKDPGHATFVGSLLFGHGAITGICPKASSGFIKVFNGVFAKPETIAKAIVYAADNWRADIINLSFGFARSSDCPKVLEEACRYAYGQGVTLVASAGNDGGPVLWPGALETTICVGSNDGTDKASFSNRGEVDFVVPGKDLQGYDTNNGIISKTGTSFSTALVTGITSLLIGQMKREDLYVDPDAVKKRLIAVCRDIGSEGYDEETGYGIPFGGITYTGLPSDSVYAKIRKLLKKAIRLVTWRKS